MGWAVQHHLQSEGKDNGAEKAIDPRSAQSQSHQEGSPSQQQWPRCQGRCIKPSQYAWLMKMEDPEPEIITESLSNDQLRSLCDNVAWLQNKTVFIWLMQVWNLMGEGLPLDGNEAGYSGSLARDVGIEQALMRESKPLSLWEQLLTSVREKFVHRDLLQQHHHETAWKTMEEFIQCLREMALLEILFEKDG